MTQTVSDILERPIYLELEDFELYVHHMEEFSSYVMNKECNKCKTKTLEPLSLGECICRTCKTIYEL